MKKNNIIIIILIVLFIIILTIVLIAKTNTKEKKKENEVKNDLSYELKDGTRLNTSVKLKEVKEFEGMEIGDIQITEKENVSILLAKITNVSDIKQGGYIINIKIIDKQGEEIKTVPFFVKQLMPNETTQLNASATFNFVNAYDFEITKKEY